ncbi:MAG: DUF3419 family protein [Proteobacteria bacterium]|nr:DUF3419 family protein [Pseudomonadota bacterium]
MINNPIQFAVVREDPCVEEKIISLYGYQKVLLIGSGGCTAFHLKSVFDDLKIALMDGNPAQLDLIKKKEVALNSNVGFDIFNVQTDNPLHLNACGNFESLFSMWRGFINEFVATKDDLMDVVLNNQNIDFIVNNPYWKTSFKLFFSDALLVTMFTESAIQHAPKGSYPLYFKNVFEAGLLRDDRATNYFLHHILFGHYLEHALPLYLISQKTFKIDELYLTNAQNFKNYADYDFISFSNIFDWMTPEDSTTLLTFVQTHLKQGASILLRQLNNDKVYTFDASFTRYDVDSKNDRSLFYNKISYYRKDR